MGTTLDRLKKQVDQLAIRQGLCPVHVTELWCPCELVWMGTEQEWDEAGTLMDRLNPDLVRIHPTGLACVACGQRRWCTACCQDQLARVDRPTPEVTPAEMARYTDLMALMQPKPLGWRPAPVPTVLPPEAAPAVSAREPRRTPAPAPVIDDDDAEVDVALAAIVTQLQARAGHDEKGIAQHLKDLIGQLE